MASEAEALKFLDVKTTIREASKIPFEVVRNRILADTPTCSCPRCMPGGLKNAGLVVPASILGLIGLGLSDLTSLGILYNSPFSGDCLPLFQGFGGITVYRSCRKLCRHWLGLSSGRACLGNYSTYWQKTA